MNHVYEIRTLIHTDRELTDDEQRELGDVADVFEGSIGGALADLGDVRFDVEVHGPKELQSA